MKNIASLIAIGALAACGLANAESMRVNVPFEFQAGAAKMPAGEYVINVKPGSGIVEIAPAGNGTRAYLSAFPGGEPAQAMRRTVVFNRYGSAYFLSDIRMPVTPALRAYKTRAEKEAAQHVRPETAMIRALSAD